VWIEEYGEMVRLGRSITNLNLLSLNESVTSQLLIPGTKTATISSKVLKWRMLLQ
jgi:hypothetical protein